MRADSAFVSDHFQPWRYDGGHAPFAIAWLSAADAQTERLVLGTSVMTPTFRDNPAVVTPYEAWQSFQSPCVQRPA